MQSLQFRLDGMKELENAKSALSESDHALYLGFTLGLYWGLFSLGFFQKDPEDWFKGGASADEEAEFDAIAKRREVARAAKDWAAADAARDEATAKGIVLEDGPDGTTWRKA